MKYQHPQIKIEEPAPGHYAITEIPPHTVFMEGVGHVVSPTNSYISPHIPDELLEGILADRKANRKTVKDAAEVDPSVHVDDKPTEHHQVDAEVTPGDNAKNPTKRGRGRPAKMRHA